MARGRPARAKAQAPIEKPVVVDEPRKRGRAARVAPQPSIDEAPTPKRHTGRPPKVAAAATEATPKRRGRPAKNTASVNLNRVAGPSRVTKSASKSASKPTSTPKKAVANSRLDPRMRSKLRTRLVPVKIQEEIVPQPSKRRGRPPKAVTGAPTPKKTAGRKPGKATAPKPVKAAVTKPTAPRKKRGYTAFEVPDKFAAQVRQYLQDLHDAEPLPTPAEDDDEETEAVPGDENEIIELHAEARADADVIIRDQVVQNIIIHEDINMGEEEVEIQTSIRETVQLEQGTNSVPALNGALNPHTDSDAQPSSSSPPDTNDDLFPSSDSGTMAAQLRALER
ncbi:hypothetical protein GQ44DRAFT_698348 [Phaeosphaeriaceae sp. PMI808]|nr:hypothetical protein GQ44DRAFT_698348 [Phaeosphaeriaceae sp. PMI808]